ncbi:hypothetical protein [Nocardia sp. NPDC057440]|uniref:hypothetical protein n=1 Tax=Nocardia sp. NPDC057440 TaxID=3346134 RepID=UPI00366E62A0
MPPGQWAAIAGMVAAVLTLHIVGWATLFVLVVPNNSVAVALLIGAQEVISILTEKLDITTGPLACVGTLDLGALGFLIVGLFALTWIVAFAVWRIGDGGHRWQSDLAGKPQR